TSQEHNFHPGQVIEKQIIVINNSRETVMCDCAWVLDISQPITGSTKIQVETGRQARVPLRLSLPDSMDPGEYKLEMTARFGNGPEQNDSFLIHVLPKVSEPRIATKIALFDPPGETAELLRGLNVAVEPIDADADLSGYDILIVGKKALTLEGPAPDIGRVRNGLKVLLFEQTAEVLEKRLGFRVQEYGLRNVFPRVSDHPVLHGLAPENLHDWRGQATLIPSRLEYELRPQHGPVIRWCGIEVSRPWRCGCWGNVASVLIEKPALGDFLPIVDGGFSLQYSPLMEYREGKGMTLFCQMDVTGRTDGDPAAKRLAANMLQYMAEYQPPGRRQPVYAGDPVGRSYFEKAGLPMAEYAGGELTPGQVLIVTPGGSEKLSSHKESILAWLK
ncbi:MAG TPA: hypothetical protein PK360_19685, partial [bacterium]|nr:hypothetical protein [bacterium]